jgi:undecaprenyl-diphosphatase
MTIFQSVILGIIQGLSEFLPISSSGHLVLAPALFGWNFSLEEAFIFNVLVQVATLIAVIVYFWKDLVKIAGAMFDGIVNGSPFLTSDSRLGWYLILATLPAALTAIFFKESFERAFSSPNNAAIFLLITSLLLVLGEIIGKQSRRIEEITWLDSIIVGIFQILALFPGISRSGATISGGLIRNLNRKSSARFSFLMAVPVMLAAGLLALIDLIQNPHLYQQIPTYLAGFVAAGIVGYLAIRWFIAFLSRKSLYYFSIYCAILGISMLFLLN